MIYNVEKVMFLKDLRKQRPLWTWWERLVSAIVLKIIRALKNMWNWKTHPSCYVSLIKEIYKEIYIFLVYNLQLWRIIEELSLENFWVKYYRFVGEKF